jgi:hypothetical protein
MINAVYKISSTALYVVTWPIIKPLEKIASIFNQAIKAWLHSKLLSSNKNLDVRRLKVSTNTLVDFGFKPHPNLKNAKTIKAQDVIDKFISLGAQITQVNGQTQLQFSLKNEPLTQLCEKMHIPFNENGSFAEISIQNPRNKTAIYCPGSGHIYEIRKASLAYLTLNCGLDLVVFHYPGNRSNPGVVNEQNLKKSVEEVVEAELLNKDPDSVVLYGHCLGAAVMSNVIESQPNLRIIVDRTFDTIEKVALHRIGILRFIPGLNFLISYVSRRIFTLDLKKALDANPAQKQLVLYSSNDEFVPTELTKQGGSIGQGRSTIDLKTDHGADLRYNPEINPLINKFLD